MVSSNAGSAGGSDSMGRWCVMAAMFSLIILINIDYTAVNVALVTLSDAMDADLNTVQWLLSAYVLAWGALVVPAGQLADIYGKRRLLLYGVWTFLIGSLVCGFSQSIEMLIFGRVVQGLAGALFVPPLYALIFTTFPPEKQGFAIGILGVGAGIGLAIGPSFGGMMIELLSWRWIFFVNVPLSLISIGITLKTIEKEPSRISDQKFDLRGGIFLCLSLVALMYALNQTEIWGLGDPLLWGCFALGGILMTGFVLSQRSRSHALIPPGIFKNKPYMGCFLGFLIFQVGFSTILVIMGLYLQNPMAYSAYDSGLIFLAMTIAIGVLSPFGGKMTDKMDPRIAICGGTAIAATGTILAMTLEVDSSLMAILIMLFTFGIGLGITFPALNATMLRAVEPKILNTASGVFAMGATLGNSLGVIMSTSLLVGIGVPLANKILAAARIPVTPEQQSSLNAYLSQAHPDPDLLESFGAFDLQSITGYMNQAFVSSMTYIMLIVTALLLGVSLLGFFWIRFNSPSKT